MENQDCVECGVIFGVPDGFTSNRRRDGRSFFCPNGHSMSYRETEGDRIRRDRDRLAQQIARVESEARDARATAESQRLRAVLAERLAAGRLTKLRKVGERVHRGLCPHCNRTFEQLARHMASKHKAGPALMCVGVT